MGRKLNPAEKPKRGPGRKSRKQSVPEFKGFIENEKEVTLSHRQRVRARKRTQKIEKASIRNAKKLKLDEESKAKKEEEEEDMDSDESAEVKQNGQNGTHQEKEAADSDEEEEESSDESDQEDEDSDDEEEDEENANDSDDDEDSDESDEDEDGFDRMEKQSKKIEREKKKVEVESEAALKDAARNVGVEIPTLEEVQKELKENPDMQAISLRIKDIIFVLAKFKERRAEGRSRGDYLSVLEHDLCAFYSYNTFLMKKLMDIFPLSELVDFLEANEVPRPVTLRTNTLKTRRKQLAQSLINQGVNMDVIPWSKVGLVVYSNGSVPLGATMEYLCGHYILQGASSFLPVVALAPKENEKILDMCAAPGGKSTHIAAMMRNTGVLISNDFNRDRTKALVGNFHRMGISNSVITCLDGRKIAKRMTNYFDRVLVDAPCSGTGVISKDEQVKVSKEAKDVKRCTHMQKELLLSAIDSVDAKSRTGGYICYSSCSILCEENEEVINYALRKRNVKLVPTGLEVGKEGFVNFKGNRLVGGARDS
ncbi:UNVERIFIED_CONTAM: hypothetical protein GTU68_022552 [Idotea baltica]|nr:hypothetical protein [Idotea baltica]